MKYLLLPLFHFKWVLITLLVSILFPSSVGLAAPRSFKYLSYKGIDQSHLEIDLYPCSDDAKSLVVYVHGGGWVKGDKSKVYSMPEFFNNYDICFASTNYPLDLPVHGSVMDLQVTALLGLDRWMKKQSFSRKSFQNITLVGHSAGAQLIALVDKRFGWGTMVKNLILMDSGSYDIKKKFSVASSRYRSLITRVLRLDTIRLEDRDAQFKLYSPALLSAKTRSNGDLNVVLLSSSRSVPFDSAVDLYKTYRSVPGYTARVVELPWKHAEFPRKIGVDLGFSERFLDIVKKSSSSNF